MYGTFTHSFFLVLVARAGDETVLRDIVLVQFDQGRVLRRSCAMWLFVGDEFELEVCPTLVRSDECQLEVDLIMRKEHTVAFIRAVGHGEVVERLRCRSDRQC
jgi:hypothetical protein